MGWGSITVDNINKDICTCLLYSLFKTKTYLFLNDLQYWINLGIININLKPSFRALPVP